VKVNWRSPSKFHDDPDILFAGTRDWYGPYLHSCLLDMSLASFDGGHDEMRRKCSSVDHWF